MSPLLAVAIKTILSRNPTLSIITRSVSLSLPSILLETIGKIRHYSLFIDDQEKHIYLLCIFATATVACFCKQNESTFSGSGGHKKCHKLTDFKYLQHFISSFGHETTSIRCNFTGKWAYDAIIQWSE